MATQANLYVDQGTDYIIDLYLADDRTRESYPTANTSFYCSVKKLYSSTTAAANCSVTAIAGQTNAINLTIPPSATENLKPGKYTYDIVMLIEDTGVRLKILEGIMFIDSTNTRF